MVLAPWAFRVCQRGDAMSKEQKWNLEALEEALDLSQRRLELAIEACEAGVYDHYVPFEAGSYFSPRWAEILGFRPDELPAREQFLDWFYARVFPDDVRKLRQSYDAFTEGRTPAHAVEVRIRHKDGNWRWVRELSRAAAREADGRVTRVVGIMLDITAQKRAEEERERLLMEERAAHAQAEQVQQRYRSVVDGVGCIVFEADAQARRFTFVNGWAEQLLGHPVERWYEQGFWIDRVVHPDDRASVVEHFGRDATSPDVGEEVEFRVLTADGRLLWLRGVTRSDLESERRLVRGVLVDVTARKHLEAQEQLLLAEVDHRAKNMLAAVQSVIQLTKPDGESAQRYAQTLIGRIRAMARAHDLLSRNKWECALLHDLVRDELQAFFAPGEERVVIEGEDVRLEPRTAQTLSLVFHELTTNAAKHGALSVPGGRVTISLWTERTGTEAILHIIWAEAGGPKVAGPKQRGFGSKVIERSVAHDLDGVGRVEFLRGGVRCSIEVPVPEVVKR
jgi:PAS domain S-box-containing protein